MADDKMAQRVAQFLEFVAAQDAAEADDHDPDNDRDVTIQGPGGTMLTLPWRQAKQYDLDGFLEGVGLKRKAAPAGGDGDGSTGDGKQGKAGKAGGTPPAAGSGVADIFRRKPPAAGKAS